MGRIRDLIYVFADKLDALFFSDPHKNDVIISANYKFFFDQKEDSFRLWHCGMNANADEFDVVLNRSDISKLFEYINLLTQRTTTKVKFDLAGFKFKFEIIEDEPRAWSMFVKVRDRFPSLDPENYTAVRIRIRRGWRLYKVDSTTLEALQLALQSYHSKPFFSKITESAGTIGESRIAP